MPQSNLYKKTGCMLHKFSTKAMTISTDKVSSCKTDIVYEQ